MLVALVANICFLVNIVRVLLVKLRYDKDTMLPKAIKATAFLIPLLGEFDCEFHSSFADFSFK